MALPSLAFTDPVQAVQVAARDNTVNIPAFQTATDPFWAATSIAEERWDENHPFQLLLLKEPGHVVVNAFTLPIPPSALSKSMPFAIDLGVSVGGITEEHNGSPIRPITLSGTTGVMPGRGEGSIQATPGLAQAVFAGTIQGLGNVAGAAARTVSTIATGGAGPVPALSNLISTVDLLGPLRGTTGYYQFLLLSTWLENYVNLKKSKAGRDYRLAFAHWKHQDVRLVTPISFDAVQTSDSPLKWSYTLSLKSWRRINLNEGLVAVDLAASIVTDPDVLHQLAQVIGDARLVLSGLRDTLLGVRADVDATLFEPLRSVAAFAKDALGVALTLADLPATIVQDAKRAVLSAASVLPIAQATGAALLSVPGTVDSEFQDLRASLKQASIQGTQAPAITGVPTALTARPSSHPAEKLFSDPNAYYDLFSSISVGALKLDPAVTKRVGAERTRVNSFKRADFQAMRDAVANFADAYADSVGAGDPRYSALRGRTLAPTARTPTDDDFDVIFTLNQTVLELNKLVAAPDPTAGSNAMDYMAGLAQASGIPFSIPKSQRYVPFPYGGSLDKLALQYLGDPNRWQEIAALNDLREPYVDEVGFDLPFAANGNGNVIPIADASQLRIDQSVWLSNSSTPPQLRHVTAIDQFAPGQALVTVDGDPTLSSFTVQTGARLHAYAQGTVNSQMLIAIPDDSPPDTDLESGVQIPGVNVFDAWYRAGGVDVGVTQGGSFAITPDGDWRLAIGLQNLIQRANNWLNTPRGSVTQRPGYGMNLQAGQSVSDLSAQQILDQMKDLTKFDPEFTGVVGATVNRSGPVTSLVSGLQVQGTNRLLPVGFDLKQ